MKRYSNIPIKERMRNADRCYRHEVKLEEINQKRELLKLIKEKELSVKEISDKEQHEAEAFARLKALTERR